MNKDKPNNDEVFNFPCEYPIKIFGKKCIELESSICRIISQHNGGIYPNNINTKVSKKGNYVSITVRIIATSRVQIDTINSQLQQHPLVAYLL